MPGGRLTRDERRLIADALSEGLGYAETARRLGRPTSTVSREVARNGGPGGYRAEHAHRATAWRARRPGEGSGDRTPPDAETDPGLLSFRAEFAGMMVATGLPRMAARVLTELFTTDAEGLTSAELVRRLRVSPASVSNAVGYLAPLGAVRRVKDPGLRRERYVLDDDMWTGAWASSTRSITVWADTARRGTEIVGAATRAGARLDRMASLFARLADDMDAGPAPLPDGEDAMTLLAALTCAGVPLTTDALAAALGWSGERAVRAVGTAERYPYLTDPVAPLRVAPDTYTAVARRDRLGPAQRAALEALAAHTAPVATAAPAKDHGGPRRTMKDHGGPGRRSPPAPPLEHARPPGRDEERTFDDSGTRRTLPAS
ncbi:helix-turn-helix domain-containing protein [Streptomyces sp. NPDC058953]|uniref:GbsR/MarR family transcriptional regulator n=1 Tax=unclassified Streptomyces TaxID=2593676 RepID=UPI0036B22F92